VQVVIWFSGLRGAIAFALAQNMPGPRRDLYTTTTLCICICTTLVCGGLTEPILDRMGMKTKGNASDLEVPIAQHVGHRGDAQPLRAWQLTGGLGGRLGGRADETWGVCACGRTSWIPTTAI
jgi:NhaP-type Na+/H+ or K+/H+ antiporter